MIFDGISHQLPDIDPTETEEWVDSFDAVLEVHGKARASFLLMKLLERAKESQVGFPATVSTPYVNTIPASQEPLFPGDEETERRIRAYMRWNAAIMVVRANHVADGIGGHLATFASSASLYEVGFNHFFRGKAGGQPGDQVFFQGHAAPGIYARAFLEGRLTEGELEHFRMELSGRFGRHRRALVVPSPPTNARVLGVPDGLHGDRAAQRHLPGSFQQVPAQPRHRRYERLPGVVLRGRRRVRRTRDARALSAWPGGSSSTTSSSSSTPTCSASTARYGGMARSSRSWKRSSAGAGWNVIKVIWGSRWDELLARDIDGVLLNKMNTTVDGEFQKFATEDGAYIREHFFGPDPRLKKLVEHLSDEELRTLPRGGHDYHKLYAAYKAATETVGQPTVILAKTIKGWALGPSIEARNSTHQIKKMNAEELKALRDRLRLQDEIPDEALEAGEPPFYRPPEDSYEYQYMMERRKALNGFLPQRVVNYEALPAPEEKAFADFDNGSGQP